MLIRIFKQGRNDGYFPTNYLMSEDKHKGHKPECVRGDVELTRDIINSIQRKNKYVSGVISFRKSEMISDEKQQELIDEFERQMAPFDDAGRFNSLWVRHMDKDKLELHFLFPRIDLKTGKGWNISPPGHLTQRHFDAFTRCKNYEYGFEQVWAKDHQGSKIFGSKSYAKSKEWCELFTNYKKNYIENYYKEKTHGRRISKPKPKFVKSVPTKSASSSNQSKLKIGINGVSFNSSKLGSNQSAQLNNTASKGHHLSHEVVESQGGNRQQHTAAQASSETSRPSKGNNPSYARFTAVGGNLDNQIRALSMQIATCHPSQRASLQTRLWALMVQKMQQEIAAGEAQKRHRPKF